MILSLGQRDAVVSEIRANIQINKNFEIGDFDEVRVKLDNLTLDQKKAFWRAIFSHNYFEVHNLLISLNFKKKQDET